MMTEDKILSRIQKMLALANDLAATEGERDNALRMAYNLMAKHNLDMVTVEARNPTSPVLTSRTFRGLGSGPPVSITSLPIFSSASTITSKRSTARRSPTISSGANRTL
jgi:hypothetical protein